MLKNEIEAALTRQLNQEQTASQEYLAMAAWFEWKNLRGFAKYMRAQSEEEREHAMRIFDHIFARGGRAVIGALPVPNKEFKGPRDVFAAAYQREQDNTKSIHALYKLASQHDDYATQTMLHWFIDEQVEEEQWCEEALALFDTIGDNPSALLMLDKRYGEMAASKD